MNWSDHPLDAWECAARRPATPVALNGLTTQQVVASGRYVLTGWCLANSGGARGTLQLYDGQDANGTPAGLMELPSNGGSIQSFPYPGIRLTIGLFVVATTATVTGSLYLTPVDDIEGERQAAADRHAQMAGEHAARTAVV